MDEKQLIAFRMKYGGKTYEEIAKATGFAEGTIRIYFSADGAWKGTYDLWAQKESDGVQDRVRKSLEGVLDIAGTIMVEALARAREVVGECKTALKKAIESGEVTKISAAEDDLRKAENRAFELAERVMDRAGMTIVSRAKLESRPNSLTDDVKEVHARLIAAGIDPASIRFRSPAPPRTEGTLPE